MRTHVKARTISNACLTTDIFLMPAARLLYYYFRVWHAVTTVRKILCHRRHSKRQAQSPGFFRKHTCRAFIENLLHVPIQH